MARVSDLKFIIPPCADALGKAQTLTRNDYLMTVLLLVNGPGSTCKVDYTGKQRFPTLPYGNYRFETHIDKDHTYLPPGPDYDSVDNTTYEERHDLFLGGRKVAQFKYRKENYSEGDELKAR